MKYILEIYHCKRHYLTKKFKNTVEVDDYINNMQYQQFAVIYCPELEKSTFVPTFAEYEDESAWH